MLSGVKNKALKFPTICKVVPEPFKVPEIALLDIGSSLNLNTDQLPVLALDEEIQLPLLSVSVVIESKVFGLGFQQCCELSVNQSLNQLAV